MSLLPRNRLCSSILLLVAYYATLAYPQNLNARLHPQSNTFNSSYRLDHSQRTSAGIDDTLANNVEVALNFERSNWAGGSVSELAFYRAPSNTAHVAAGTILKVEVDANTSAFTLPPNTAISRIMYQTETLNGSLVPASAFVLWPYLPRNVSDGYPVVSWAHPTVGVFAECGPSHVRNLWYHFEGPYSLALQGFVVVAPDYQGLGVGQDAAGNTIPHPYLSLPSHANDVFYATQAAQTAFKSLSSRFVVVGHSQGGGVAWAAAERQATRPVKGYLGAVAGSPVTDFVAQVDLQEQTPNYVGALLIRGLQSLFPDFNISSVLTTVGPKRFNLAAEIQGCNPVFSELFATTSVGGRDIAGPLLVVQGAADQVVPAQITDMAVNHTCRNFPHRGLEYQSYANATHVPVMYAAQRNWLQWVEDRFEGKTVEQKCIRKDFQSALSPERYQTELNWFIEYAQDTYETQ